MKTLFETIHGSRLYNLHHDDSDYDYFRVVTSAKKTTQIIEGSDDNLTIPFDKFMDRLNHGSPQSLEALFSRYPTTNELEWLRQGFRIGINETFHTYMRTIKAFAHTPDHKHVLKRQRHAFRLAFNLEDLYHCGWFNPTLSKSQRNFILSITEPRDPEDILREISSRGVFEI